MGAGRHIRGSTPGRRLLMPAALALVLTVAGSTSPHERGEVAAPVAGPSASPTPAPPASLTLIEPQQYPRGRTPAPAVRIAATGSGSAKPSSQVDIAGVLLKAYRLAAASAPASCHLPVSLLAAIGEVESGSLVGREVDARHRTSVLGPVLDGRDGFKAVADTDNGRWDGDKRWDRAVGPLQFIPGTWARFGVDGDGDGVADPQDVEDASASAAAYLCYGGRDLSVRAEMRSAVLAYNASSAYEHLVLTYQQRYAALGLDDGTTVVGLPTPLSAVGAPVAGEPTTDLAIDLAIDRATPHRRGHSAKRSSTADRTEAAGQPTATKTPAADPGSGGSSGASESPRPAPSSPQPSPSPTDGLTDQTTDEPTAEPTDEPTACPTDQPDPETSGSPAADPSDQPAEGSDASGEPDQAGCPPCEPTDGPSASASPSPSPSPDDETTQTCEPDSTTTASTAASPSSQP